MKRRLIIAGLRLVKVLAAGLSWIAARILLRAAMWLADQLLPAALREAQRRAAANPIAPDHPPAVTASVEHEGVTHRLH